MANANDRSKRIQFRRGIQLSGEFLEKVCSDFYSILYTKRNPLNSYNALFENSKTYILYFFKELLQKSVKFHCSTI